MVRKIRGQALYSGVEHPGLYPTATVSAQEIAEWYAKVFGFKLSEGRSSYFLASDGPGRIEVMKGEPGNPCHLAIKVSDFEAAVADLQAKGVELLEPRISAASKAIYFKNPDPAGNIVHILWTP
ncbi:MAG: VOC family protein [Chloroflexota bacterium]